MSLSEKAVEFAAKNTRLPSHKCQKALDLLITQECTLPFVARYRKDQTGALDERQLGDVLSSYETFMALEHRREFILAAIEKKGQLSPELKTKILAATDITQLEDLYGPYKSKVKTRAEKAIESGLEPFAKLLLNATKSLEEMEKAEATEFYGPDKPVHTFTLALIGAKDIIASHVGHNLEVKNALRDFYWNKALFCSSLKDKGDKIKDYQKYKDFFEYSEPVSNLKNAKATHRFLAVRRGVKQRVLKLAIQVESEEALALIQSLAFKNMAQSPVKELLQECCEMAFKDFLHPGLETELKAELKDFAEDASIDVFNVNLKNLLLQPYLGPKITMGVDPGVKTGCKVVMVDGTGKYLGNVVIFPHPPKKDIEGSITIINKILDVHPIEHIAIGNGTFGRETLEFFETHIDRVKSGEVKATLISEAGASIYSASEFAQKEFPELDLTVRGAISIARRFQDPLAELVKIDPKSIGVGQYQHDLNQSKLNKSLGRVVESCVNFVGVDLNTASAPLLSYVSGIGPKTAENIVEHRERHGQFQSREDLKSVPRFSEKVFQQAAGFLRIYSSKNPLDATFIHPENYSVLGGWVNKKDKTIHDLFEGDDLLKELSTDQDLKKEIGSLTFSDIVTSIKAPSQDPRTQFKSVEFDPNLKSIGDLQKGSWYKGVVSNITLFGAFIDIGIKEKGLVHVSEVDHKFIRNALDALTIGQEVRARVIDLDLERSRISLSLKSEEAPPAAQRPRRDRSTSGGGYKGKSQRPGGKGPGRGGDKKKRPPHPRELKQNPFAVLKDLKVK